MTLEQKCRRLVKEWRESLAALEEIDAVITHEERTQCAWQLEAILPKKRKKKAQRKGGK